jgi:adenylate cyclase
MIHEEFTRGTAKGISTKCDELAKAHDTVQQQATKLKEQTEQLGSWNLLLEERVAAQLAEIERIGRLQRFLAPQLAEVIASSDENASLLASHRREVTVVFCDLRGFTAFTESTEPEEVMRVLREYHAALGEIIFHYEGTLDRFAGDGILILFNDPIPYPDHTQRAVRMALEMRDCVGKLSENWRSRGHVLGSELELLSAMLRLDKSAWTVAWSTRPWGALPISLRGSATRQRQARY